MSEAELLRGAELRVPFSERAALETGEFYHSDLVGCEVIEQQTGNSLGPVASFEESGGTGLLVLASGLMIPFARSICVAIEPTARRIVVDLPEGLKDINRP